MMLPYGREGKRMTEGLSSHWPCVAAFSDLSTYGLTTQGKETITPPAYTVRHGTLCLYGLGLGLGLLGLGEGKSFRVVC